jgi:hypothetical protein
MKKAEKKSFDSPDESRSFGGGKVDLITMGGITFGRGTLQPGWKWSKDVKPIVKTKSCQQPHTHYVVAGKMHVVMDDGTELDFEAGDVGFIPPGHDAWIVGNKPFVAIDVTGMKDYAKPSKK